MMTQGQERKALFAERFVRQFWGRRGRATGPYGFAGGAPGQRYNVECPESRDKSLMFVEVEFTESGFAARLSH